MDKLYIVIPAYNEQDNIEQVINDWYPIIERHNGAGQSRLVIIDDGSKDSTYEKIKQCAQKRALLIPLTKPNGGHGATVLYGYKYCFQNSRSRHTCCGAESSARACRKGRSGNADNACRTDCGALLDNRLYK